MFKRSSGHTGAVPDETQRRGELVLRTLPVLIIPFSTVLIAGMLIAVASGRGLVPPPGAPQPPIYGPLIPIVVLVIFCSALIMLVRLGRPTISALALIAVWTLITTLAALGNGVTTFWPALLLMPICAAGLLIDGTASVSLAALATLLVGSSAWLEMQGLTFPKNDVPPAVLANLPYLSVGFWSALFWTVAALTSLLAGSLQRALRQSRAQAAELSALSAQLEARVAEQTAELAQRTARAEALYEVSRALTSTLDLTQVLGLIAEQAARLLRFDASLVLLAQPNTPTFALVGATDQPGQPPLPLPEREALVRRVLARQTPTVVQLEAGDGTGPASALALPLRYDAQPIGVLLLVEHARTAERSADDLALAEGFASQAAVAIANAQLLVQSREAATLEERTRLAREMHDTLAQGLTGIVVQLGAAQRALLALPDEAEQHLQLAQRMARESLAEARRSVWNLRAPALERGDLSDALRGLVERPLRPEIVASFDQRGAAWPLSPSVESELLRVGQEALVNVAKHAAARSVAVVLEYSQAAVRLSVRDDGVGFDATMLRQHIVAASPWQGFGLLGMRERLAALGGTLTLRNDGGAEVLAEVPRARAQQPEPTLPALEAAKEA